ncbi:MAG: hypothetical protein J6R03_06700 [Treponema sp.]|nr:hypothetical protein [Treponema sp.]
MAIDLSEEKLMGMLTTALQKSESEGNLVSIGIYTKSEEKYTKLAETIFDENFSKNCIFIQNDEDLTSQDLDVLWSFEDIVSTSIPCFFIQNFSIDEIFFLLNWTFDNIPSSKKKSFVKHQKIDIDLKERYANTIIKHHCAGSFGIGFIPIPFSDAPALVANEITLMGRILDVYGLSDIQLVIRTVGLSTLIGNLLTMLGKGLVGQLLKIIPGVGTILGGIINGSTATTVTLAFGKSVSKVVKQLCKSSIQNNQAEIDYLTDNFARAITGTAVACIESGLKTAEDYEKSFDNTELSISEFEKNVQRGNELFQVFLDKNFELTNEFESQQKESNKKTEEMWNAISRL